MSYFVHHSSFVDEGAEVGEGSRIWHFTHLMPGARVGRGCNIGQNVYIAYDAVLGDHCKVQNNVSIYPGVICGDNVFLGPSMVFTNVKNPRSEVDRRDDYLTTRVGDGATIGANATIVCGITLGEYCFIGAGSVVTKDVPPYALMIGNPARRDGWMSRNGQRLVFENGLATDPEDGRQYRLTEAGVALL